jgi:GntR family transcriptional regulator/MocR family aminotransferase
VQRAKEDGVRVYGLERYCIGAAADPAQGGTVLLGYAGLSEEEIAEAAAILKKCWNA